MPRDLIQHPDPLPIAHPDTVRDKPDLSRPSLEALAYILRHREEWKPNHIWNFQNALMSRDGNYCGDEALKMHRECGTAGCAMGIAALRWGAKWLEWDEILGIGEGGNGWQIFSRGIMDSAITPEVVAGRIDDHLAGRPIRYLVEGDRGTAGR